MNSFFSDKSASNIIFSEKEFSKTFKRNKKRLCVLGTVFLLFSFTFLTVKFFKKMRPLLKEEKMINKCMDYINEEMDRICKLETRALQNREFKQLRPELPLIPIRMTQTTAVFKYTYTSPQVVLKRIIYNPNNILNEDIMSRELKGKSEHLVETILTNRTTRRIPDPEDPDRMIKQTLIWIFTEFLDVKISADYVQGDEEIISDIMHGALKGLKYLHDNKYAHLDLKIANIMGKKTPSGDVIYKLIDFGYTQKFEAGQAFIARKNYGTYPYKPPELIKKHMHGPKADIWSLGATAWFLSLQYVPFYDDKMQKDMKSFSAFISEYRGDKSTRGNHKFFFTRETSDELKDFIKTSMQIDADSRPTVDELLNHPFITKSRIIDYDSDSRDEIEGSSYDSYSRGL